MSAETRQQPSQKTFQPFCLSFLSRRPIFNSINKIKYWVVIRFLSRVISKKSKDVQIEGIAAYSIQITDKSILNRSQTNIFVN